MDVVIRAKERKWDCMESSGDVETTNSAWGVWMGKGGAPVNFGENLNLSALRE